MVRVVFDSVKLTTLTCFASFVLAASRKFDPAARIKPSNEGTHAWTHCEIYPSMISAPALFRSLTTTRHVSLPVLLRASTNIPLEIHTSQLWEFI